MLADKQMANTMKNLFGTVYLFLWISYLFIYLFIDQITTKSGRAARIETYGAYYIQATHLQTIQSYYVVIDK